MAPESLERKPDLGGNFDKTLVFRNASLKSGAEGIQLCLLDEIFCRIFWKAVSVSLRSCVNRQWSFQVIEKSMANAQRKRWIVRLLNLHDDTIASRYKA
jgi:hypothetical protein